MHVCSELAALRARYMIDHFTKLTWRTCLIFLSETLSVRLGSSPLTLILLGEGSISGVVRVKKKWSM